MIADQATPATLTSALTVAGFRTSLDPFSLSANRCWRIPRSLGLSVQAPAAQLIRSTRISNLSAPFPRPKKRQDSTSPREVPRGPVPLFSRCSLRVSGTLWDASHLPDLSLPAVSSIVGSHSENHYGSSIKIRNHPIRPGYLS
jgi:hypothetical protein